MNEEDRAQQIHHREQFLREKEASREQYGHDSGGSPPRLRIGKETLHPGIGNRKTDVGSDLMCCKSDGDMHGELPYSVFKHESPKLAEPWKCREPKHSQK